jgi:hypothetical protein
MTVGEAMQHAENLRRLRVEEERDHMGLLGPDPTLRPLEPTAEEAQIIWTRNVRAGLKGFRQWLHGHPEATHGRVVDVFDTLFPESRR